MKLLYIVIILILVIVLCILLIKTKALFKKITKTSIKVSSLKNKIDTTSKRKIDTKKEKPCISLSSLIIIFSLLNEINNDYKKPSRKKKTVIKSVGKTLVKNYGKIRKIKPW